MAALRTSAEELFLRRMMAHLRAQFPAETQGQGDAFETYVRSGITSAAQFGIVTARDICLFLDLRVIFGPDFPDSPAAAWARKYQNDAEVPDAAHRLYRAAIARLEIEENNRSGAECA